MLLRDLKKSIESHFISDALLVFVCEENFFIADEYTDAIGRIQGKEKKNIGSLAESKSAYSMLFDQDDTIKVLKTEIFSEAYEDYSVFTDTIIICKKIDKFIADSLSQYTVKVPTLKDWQIKDYIKKKVNISADDAEWLCDVASNDIYRINNELDKIRLFPKPEAKLIFAEIKTAENTDLFKASVFDFTEAIVKGNKPFVRDCLRHLDCCDLDPFAVTNILIKTNKKILFAATGNKQMLEAAGISQKAAYAISRSYSGISLGVVMYNIDFLTELDYRLKSGKLDMPKNALLEYIVCKLMK